MIDPQHPVIEVFADIWCPFTHVGLHLVDRYRAQSGHTDVALLVRAWPLELINGRPLDPATTAIHADELREQVSPELFTHLDTAQFPTSTLDALALAAHAAAVDVEVGERVSFDLREALFERGQDIADREVLGEIARRAGLDLAEVGEADHAAVLADWHEGQARGVVGSPHFFSGDRNAFCPSLQITKTPAPGSGLTIGVYTSNLTSFLDACFAALDEARGRGPG
jgi:predicted DsbA family dithiol-disulfide isomerase